MKLFRFFALLTLCFGLLGCYAPAQAAVTCNCVHILQDVSYGAAALQTMDVYIPANITSNAPIVLMVHGGNWQNGSKSDTDVVSNKVAYFLPLGFIFVSTNYRLSPNVSVVTEAANVASALAFVQTNAASWGGSASKVILMGNTAGGHLVALVASSTVLQANAGVQPWLGTIALDATAYNINEIMQGSHFPFYDSAFGTTASVWQNSSPTLQLTGTIPPMLEICSTQRAGACAQATEFNNAATVLGSDATVYQIAMPSQNINSDLGLPNLLTSRVQSFLCSKFRLDCGH